MSLTEVTPASVVYICLAGIFVACTILSRLIKEKLFVNEFVIGTIGGILLGPFVTNIFSPRRWTTHSNQFTLECMRIVLVLRLFAIGVELPGSYLRKHARSLLLMVIPTMVIGWPMIAAIVYFVFPELDFVSCLVISSCLVPTDPVGCANFVSGRFAKEHLTLDIRQLLVAQSATGDALAYPFLSLALYLTVDKTPGDAFYHWITIGCLYQVVLVVTIGVILGFFFSFVMKQCYKYGVIDRESYAGQFLGLAMFIAGVARAIGCNDLVATFAAGTALSWDGVFNEQLDGEQVFTSVITTVVNSTCSMYIGAWLPFSDFVIPELGVTPLKLVVLASTILLIRRIPAFLTVYKLVPEISSWREALLCGYFGPVCQNASVMAITHRLCAAGSQISVHIDVGDVSPFPIRHRLISTTTRLHSNNGTSGGGLRFIFRGHSWCFPALIAALGQIFISLTPKCAKTSREFAEVRLEAAAEVELPYRPAECELSRLGEMRKAK